MKKLCTGLFRMYKEPVSLNWVGIREVVEVMTTVYGHVHISSNLRIYIQEFVALQIILLLHPIKSSGNNLHRQYRMPNNEIISCPASFVCPPNYILTDFPQTNDFYYTPKKYLLYKIHAYCTHIISCDLSGINIHLRIIFVRTENVWKHRMWLLYVYKYHINVSADGTLRHIRKWYSGWLVRPPPRVTPNLQRFCCRYFRRRWLRPDDSCMSTCSWTSETSASVLKLSEPFFSALYFLGENGES